MHIHIPGLYWADAVRQELEWFQQDYPHIANRIMAVRTASIESSWKAISTYNGRIAFDPLKLHPDDGWNERYMRHIVNHECAHHINYWFVDNDVPRPKVRIPHLTKAAEQSDIEMFCEVWAVYRTNPDKKVIVAGEKIVKAIEGITVF